ncbi:MAG: hypothetical protein ACXABY_00145 [Candidatus Thorarchaeota archaeon]
MRKLISGLLLIGMLVCAPGCKSNSSCAEDRLSEFEKAYLRDAPDYGDSGCFPLRRKKK